MFIDVNKIQSTRFDFDRELDPTVMTPAVGGELSVLSCRLAGYIENEQRGKRLSAHLDAELLITCGRCLEAFKFAISSKFSLILVSKIKTSAASERELTRDELSLFPTSEGKLELEELAREQIHLNIPLKLLCRPDCQGLCASCGVDKNNIQCECVSETIDLRLAQLLEIKKKFGKPE